MKHLITIFILLISIGLYGQSGKISGQIFGDYFYNISRDSEIQSLSNVILKDKKDLNGFHLRRVYFTYDYDISKIFSTRFRIEADNSITASNKMAVAVKDIYLKWVNIISGSDIIIGLQPTPAFQISESVWGYRPLEKTIMDLRGAVSSRDIGISLKGKLNSSGSLNYWFMFGNNSSNSTEMDKYKRLYGHIYLKPSDNTHITIYSDIKFKPSFTENSVTLSNNDYTSSVLAGYTAKEYAAGVEGFLTLTENGFKDVGTETTLYKTKSALGISAFGLYNFSDITSAVLRYDYYDPNTASGYTGDVRKFIIISFVYRPDEAVSIMPNVLIETYESVNEKNYDSSLTGRITFSYRFL